MKAQGVATLQVDPVLNIDETFYKQAESMFIFKNKKKLQFKRNNCENPKIFLGENRQLLDHSTVSRTKRICSYARILFISPDNAGFPRQ